MEIRGNAEVHHLNVLSVQETAVIIVEIWNIKLLGSAPGMILVPGSHGKDLHLGSPEAGIILKVKMCGKLRADDTQSYLVHH
jgi:hypothetical protein